MTNWKLNLALVGCLAFAGELCAQNVLVVRDSMPNGGDAVQEFTNLGATVSEISSSQLSGWNLSPYCVVYVTGIGAVSGDAQNIALNNAASQLEAYASAGGTLFYETGSDLANFILPANVGTAPSLDWETMVVTGHPIADTMPAFLSANCSALSANTLVNLPANAITISTGTSFGSPPVTASYAIGSGEVIATGCLGEWGLPSSNCWVGTDGTGTLWLGIADYCLSTCTAQTADTEDVPQNFSLGNYPNPFNPTTTIHFTLSKTENLRLAVYDLMGQQVRLLHNGMMARGEHAIPFDAASLPSGNYFYRLEHGDQVHVNKMLLLK